MDKYKETNVQRYRCTKDSLISFNWAFPRDISQKPVELPCQWHNPFCTYQQDRWIGFGMEEGLLESHL